MLKCILPASAKFTTQSIPCCKLICPPLPLPVPLALASPTWCIRDVSLLPLWPLIEMLKSAGLSIALCHLQRLSHISRQVREQRAILWKPAWESELRTETWSSKWWRQEEAPTRPTEMSAPYKVISERLLTLQCSSTDHESCPPQTRQKHLYREGKWPWQLHCKAAVTWSVHGRREDGKIHTKWNTVWGKKKVSCLTLDTDELRA